MRWKSDISRAVLGAKVFAKRGGFMVQSKAEDVGEWMTALPPERSLAFERLRLLCRERLPGWVERMQWGMPGYGPQAADAIVSFNSQKHYIALYVGPTAIARAAHRLGNLDRGKGCIRFRRSDQMDFALIGDMLDEIYVRGGPMC